MSSPRAPLKAQLGFDGRGARLDRKHFRKGGEEKGQEHGEVNGTCPGRGNA